MKFFTSLIACFAIFIFGGCATKTGPVKPTTLTDIVNDVATNGVNSKYKGQKVKITAAGRIYPKVDENSPKLELFTHHDKVYFFIPDSDAKFVVHNDSDGRKSDLGHIRGHTTYAFTLVIKDISEDTTTDGDRFFIIRSDVPEHTAEAGIEVIDTTLEQIVAGKQNYLGKTVHLQATVSLDRLNELLKVQGDIDPELVKNYSGAMTLATNNRDVTFWIVDDTPGGGPFLSNFEKYKNHQTYTFTLYIERIVREKGQVEITTGIADD